MYLFLISTLLVYAEPIELKHYTVLDTVDAGKQWVVSGEEGFYVCTAETSCDGFGSSDEIIAGRALWYDPIMVFQINGTEKTRCYLKTCVRPKPLTYQDLRWNFQ